MKDKLNRLQGRIKITCAKTGKVLYEKHNTIQPYALTALINMIAGNVGYNPKSIILYQSSTPLVTELLDSFSLDVGANSITMVAFFDGSSFTATGTLNQASLECTGGQFALATISYTIPIGQAIYFSWTITTS